ncbi:MAG TPA: hypothetical protein VL547_18860 [Dinghuibacter sp.]|uniref:hypothetical protein n=1 Tax=Dinghuibacter sp. TaxID=2024697 RepID=UPI002BD92AEA|nr:hypothetical protein [Dinghuibacter sp.]HTJ14110.1 hypothetical protein [Dinghuibacter sp.]
MKSTFVLALLCAAVAARAQNTFPSSGAVGIGTTTPASPLEIKTGVNWDATSSNYAGALDLGYNNDYGAGNPAQYLLLFPQFAGSIVSAAGMSGVIRDYRGMGVTFNSPSEYTIVGQTAYGNSYINVIPRSVVSGVLTVYSVTYGGVVYLALRGQDLCGSSAHLTCSGCFWNEINGVKPQLVASSSCTNVSIFTETTELIPNALSANTENYIGVGTNNPEEPLHVVGHADALNVGGQYNGDAVIQANTGGRTATSGGA